MGLHREAAGGRGGGRLRARNKAHGAARLPPPAEPQASGGYRRAKVDLDLAGLKHRACGDVRARFCGVRTVGVKAALWRG